MDSGAQAYGVRLAQGSGFIRTEVAPISPLSRDAGTLAAFSAAPQLLLPGTIAKRADVADELENLALVPGIGARHGLAVASGQLKLLQR